MIEQKPVMLLILDGWGFREPKTPDNAIEMGNTPNWHKLIQDCPHSLIETYGLSVGLPDGQMGNSEVGHTNLGAGRVVMQDLPRIDVAIKENTLKDNKVLQEMIQKLHKTNGTCHLMGLLSDGGVHSHISHIIAVAEILSENGVKVAIHAYMDGRDTPPTSGKKYLADLTDALKNMKNVDIATVSGRFYAMDRDKRWDRIELAYDNLILANGKHYATADEAITASYESEVTDEFVLPCVVGNYTGMKDGDAVLMINYRADRAREILYALADEQFAGFERKKVVNFVDYVGMAEYSEDHNRFMHTMFPPVALNNIFGEIVSKAGLTQLRIAETEKYAHVTFFFNGGEEKEFAGESRILIPSPKVATYDLKPEMSIYEVTEALIDAIENKKYDVIICNFANGDMIGHTGIMPAALKAVAAVDECLGKVEDAIKKVDGLMLVTADHGNVEKMYDEITKQPHTAHTAGRVLAALYNAPDKYCRLKDGKLADIAPTLLELLDIEKPADMTGESLLVKNK